MRISLVNATRKKNAPLMPWILCQLETTYIEKELLIYYIFQLSFTFSSYRHHFENPWFNSVQIPFKRNSANPQPIVVVVVVVFLSLQENIINEM